MSLRTQIENAGQRPPRRVVITVPGFEGDHFVRGLTIGERDAYEGACLVEKSFKGRVAQTVTTENMRARLLALCLVDESGTRLFAETKADLAVLAKLPADVGEPLFEAARVESGMSEKDIEELKGN
jgi:hypothetical protein